MKVSKKQSLALSYGTEIRNIRGTVSNLERLIERYISSDEGKNLAHAQLTVIKNQLEAGAKLRYFNSLDKLKVLSPTPNFSNEV